MMENVFPVIPPNIALLADRVWAHVFEWLLHGYDTLADWLLMTPAEAIAVYAAVTALFFLPAVYVWLRYDNVPERVVRIAFLALPAALVVLMQTPTGFIGRPDDNCTKYERGKMTYSLLYAMTVPKTSTNVYGDQWLMLYVQNERWGDEIHECRVSLADPKVRILAKVLHDAQLSGNAMRFSRGQFSFSFGGRNEVPNVKIEVKKPLPKAGPPERQATPQVPHP